MMIFRMFWIVWIALRSDDNAYTSYAGKSDKMDGNVKFVIETEAIDND